MDASGTEHSRDGERLASDRRAFTASARRYQQAITHVQGAVESFRAARRGQDGRRYPALDRLQAILDKLAAIEHAKDILIVRLHCTPEQAATFLRQESRLAGITVSTLAARIVAAADEDDRTAQ